MNIESIPGDAENSTSSSAGLSRRGLMRAGAAGAAVAWSVPLVQVAAAAPANAACSGTPSLKAEATNLQRPTTGQENGNLLFDVVVTNPTGGTANGLTVSVYQQGGWTAGWNIAAAWDGGAFVPPTAGGSGTQASPYSFTAPSPQSSVQCGSSHTLRVRVSALKGKIDAKAKPQFLGNATAGLVVSDVYSATFA